LHPGQIVLFQPDANPTKMFVAIGDKLSDMTTLTITSDRRAFNSNVGRDLVNYLAIHQAEGGIMSLLEGPGHYFVFSAIAALFDFISTTSDISFKEKSVFFKKLSIDGRMMIDYQTTRCLELVENNKNNKSSESLFGILNHCSTKMGSRLLRSSILQPLTKVVEIQLRQQAVKELSEQRDFAKNLSNVLCDVPDLDNLIASLIQIPKNRPEKFCEQSINRILMFKQVIEKSICLKDRLTGANLHSSILVSMCHNLNRLPLDQLLQSIDDVIEKDVNFQKSSLGLRNQRCSAVKSGFDGLLDVARQTYKEANEDVNETFASYSETYQFPFKLAFNSGLGFYVSLSLEELGQESLPDIFINIVRRGKLLHFSTLELTCLNVRIQEALQEVYNLSEKIITDLLICIHQRIETFYAISEHISMIDFLLSLCIYSFSSNQSCLPEFSLSLALKDARHPILDKSMAATIVPNDIYADSSIRLQFLTGPNMSGKSTYFSQIALLQVMAQIGSYIPCQFASIRICEQLLTRIGYDDSIVAQVSSFSLEMKECAFILEHITSSSLVIIDELGRGTSTSDAVAISIAIAESVLDTKAILFFSTHFDQVCKAFESNPNAAVLQMKTIQSDQVLISFNEF
jgi:DNA mismatch repair protein MSH4